MYFFLPFLGYATTSGRYFNDRQIYYAVGAPRADLVGKVCFIIDSSFVITWKGLCNKRLHFIRNEKHCLVILLKTRIYLSNSWIFS